MEGTQQGNPIDTNGNIRIAGINRDKLKYE
jgi:hypothetical protein